jgi:hypothetical protein
MSCGEAIKRLDEDATRAPLVGTEESADGDLKPNLRSEDGFLGESSKIATVDSPALLATRGTGRVRGCGGDPAGQSVADEIRSDEAAADGSAKELGKEQTRLSSHEKRGGTRNSDNLATLLDHKKC